MKRSAIFIIVFLFSQHSASSQFKVSIGLQYGRTSQSSLAEDEGDHIEKGFNIYAPSWGLTLETTLYKNIYLEVGYRKMNYKLYGQFYEKYSADNFLGGHINYKKHMQFPLSVNHKIPLSTKINFLYGLGPILGYYSDYRPGISPYLAFQGNHRFIAEGISTIDYYKTFYLLQLKMGFELLAGKNEFVLSFNAIRGFNKLFEDNMRYSFHDSPNWYNVSMSTMGNYFLLGIAYRYRFIDLNKKKKDGLINN